MKSQKYKPYVRRANGREKAETLRIAYRLAFYRMRRKPFYVMVQRGFPNLAIEVGATKRDVQTKPVMIAWRGWKFKAWARHVYRNAIGVERKGWKV